MIGNSSTLSVHFLSLDSAASLDVFRVSSRLVSSMDTEQECQRTTIRSVRRIPQMSRSITEAPKSMSMAEVKTKPNQTLTPRDPKKMGRSALTSACSGRLVAISRLGNDPRLKKNCHG